MPQGRKKVPFSSKQKKKQLQQKREVKQTESSSHGRQVLEYSTFVNDALAEANNESSIQDVESLGATSGKYNLKFHSKQAFKNDRDASMSEPIKQLPKTELELDFQGSEDFEMPIRPSWNRKMTKQQLDMQENRYFREYVKSLENHSDFKEMGIFELNLETWRQLWRVLEKSDLILLIADARNPVLHFPRSLYKYVTKDLKKKLILILNKVDLVAPSVAVAWKHFFQTLYPDLEVIFFCSLPRKVKNEKEKEHLEIKKAMILQNMKQLWQICDEFVGEYVDLSSWKKKIEKDALNYFQKKGKVHVELKTEDDMSDHFKFQDGVLILGFLGYPNVGKSSLLNTLMGKKVVSVSRTPGHTKYFQTIFITPTVKLCDCPGLVFPSIASKHLQVLTGSYPISQVRNPYSSIKFLAEHLDIVSLLKLKLHEEDETCQEDVTAFSICQAWAIKRGFYTAKASRPDVSRAANNLLRMALNGQISLCFHPPGYFEKEQTWLNHPDAKLFADLSIYCKDFDLCDKQTETSDDSSSEEESEDDNFPKPAVNMFSYLSCDD